MAEWKSILVPEEVYLKLDTKRKELQEELEKQGIVKDLSFHETLNYLINLHEKQKNAVRGIVNAENGVIKISVETPFSTDGKSKKFWMVVED